MAEHLVYIRIFEASGNRAHRLHAAISSLGGPMSEDLAKAYVDGLLQDGFAIDVIGDDVIVIVDPPNAQDVINARDTKRVANPGIHKDAIVSYLKAIHRIV